MSLLIFLLLTNVGTDSELSTHLLIRGVPDVCMYFVDTKTVHYRKKLEHHRGRDLTNLNNLRQ